MTEPTTAAGRALVDELVNRAGKPAERLLREQVLAVEAEAAGQERTWGRLAKLRQRYVDEVLAEQTRASDRASWAVLSFLDAFDEAMR